MDASGGADGSVGEEEGSDGGEKSVGDSDGGVDAEVERQVGARVAGGRQSLQGGARGGPGRRSFSQAELKKKKMWRRGAVLLRLCGWRTYVNPAEEKSSRRAETALREEELWFPDEPLLLSCEIQ